MRNFYFIFIAIVAAFIIFFVSITQCTTPPQSTTPPAQIETSSSNMSGAGSEANDESTSNKEEVKTQYAYEFAVSRTTYRISFDVEEGTAQLFVKGRLAPNGKTFYGTCQREYDNPNIIKTQGFKGADDFDIKIEGERNFWVCYQYIDTKNNYIYLDLKAYKAKNPDYRIALEPVN